MSSLDYDVHFGSVSEESWARKSLGVNDPDPDDEELSVTPPDVVAMLGFDPKEFDAEDALEDAHWANQPRAPAGTPDGGAASLKGATQEELPGAPPSAG